MGLDITLYKVVQKNDTYPITLHEWETNKSKLALFEKYKEWVEDSKDLVIDVEETFNKYGLKLEDFEWRKTSHDSVEWENINTKDRFVCDWSDMVTKEVVVKKLYCEEIAYQRKDMSKDFYTKFLAGCWYVSEDTELNEDDSKDYVLDQDTLNEAKQFAHDYAPIKDWVLGENEFVGFCY